MALLEVKDLGISFGGLRAVDGFEINIENGELYGIIGPNGAGKTTVFNLLTGVYRPTDGSIVLDGVNLVGKKPIEICKAGITRTFQNIRLFKNMKVIDNVRTGLHNSKKYSLLEGIFRLPRYFKEEREIKKEAMELLSVFHMENDANTIADNLPYGKQRKLEIARALAAHPKLLLLDEPAAGMNPTETQELMETIRLIRDKFGIAVLLIEHDMSLVLGICERLTVLDYGQIIASGDPMETVKNKRVVEAYLGE